MIYCSSCGRPYENNCNCIHTTKINKWEYYLLILFVMIVPMVINSYTFMLRGKVLDNFNYMFTGALSLSFVTVVLFIIYYVFNKNYIAVFYGCHQKTSRTIKHHNHYFVLCARCTGIQIGIFLSIGVALLNLNYLFYLLLIIPILVDGLVQQKTKYVSNNVKRILTGVLFGPALVVLFGGFYYLILLLANELVQLI